MTSIDKPRHKSIFGQPESSPSSDEDDEVASVDVSSRSSSVEVRSPIPEDEEHEEDVSSEDLYEKDADLKEIDEGADSNESDGYPDSQLSYDGYTHWKSKVHNLAQRQKWLALTSQDRKAAEFLSSIRAKDLTGNLLNTHGITAKQYGPQLGNIGQPGYSSEDASSFDRFQPRVHWDKSAWKPRAAWDRWPLRPFTVPRKQSQVWSSSLTKSDTWSPSKELEQNIFAFLLKTAHAQWKNRDDSESEPPAKRVKVDLGHDTDLDDYGSEAEDVDDGKLKIWPKTSSKKEQNAESEVLERPSFSADDERSLRILKPIIRSTISSLDKVLMSIYKSQASSQTGSDQMRELLTQKPMVRDETKQRNHATVDWSHVIGLAAISGIPPQVISRATTRCSRALSESMSLNVHREEDASQSVKSPTIFAPNDFDTRDPDTRFGELPPRDWIEEDGCPYPECRWFRRRMAPGANDDKIFNWKLFAHLKSEHAWYDGVPRDTEEYTSGMSGGVHIDGFLQPIAAGNGWRGKDTVTSTARIGIIRVGKNKNTKAKVLDGEEDDTESMA